MSYTAKVKELMIRLLGPRVSAVVHGARFATLATDERFTDREIEFVKRHLRSGDVAVDVGANGADWTRQLSKIVGKNGVVYAFEADPYYAEATKWACRFLGLGNVHLFSFGLSEAIEQVCLNATDAHGGRASGTGKIDRSKNDDKFVYSIELRPLDSLVWDWPRLQNCRVIKCDVEGFELFVLRGAREIIAKSCPMIIFEVGRFEEQGYGPEDIILLFEELNYKSYYVDATGSLTGCDNMLSVNSTGNVNRIALPNESCN